MRWGMAVIDSRGKLPVLSVSPVLQIVRFCPRRVEVDDAVRQQLVPALRLRAGPRDVIAGRHGPDELGERIIVSVWSAGGDAGALERTSTLEDLVPSLDVFDVRSDHLVVRVEFHDARSRTARLLRIFRGQVRSGELDRYIEVVDAGTRSDAAAGHGPIALLLGVEATSHDAFVTVSTWPDWSTIEAATGGDVRRPIATRNPELLVASEVTHFEVIEG